ncbi:MAG: RecBCD enzyme subunit RecC [Lentisphaerae bacterium ADurb.Bin242]|nr:MAG: RecBCD enzyme subunit RecC [Lentisphaerae bacterium ADurb.Bin242]
MGFHLYSSNKAEILAERLAERIYLRPEGDLFTPETVVVQTQGMAAWLKLVLGEKAPVAANLKFPFLNTFILSVLEKAFPEEDFHNTLEMMSQEVMTWRIFQTLSESPERYPELRSYLSAENTALRTFQLSEKIAGLFDQYQIYHGDMLEQWRRGAAHSGGWQARLYLELAESSPGPDVFFRWFEDLRNPPRGLYLKRVSVFGISAMAPVYFRFFVQLSRFTEVHFFYLNPCAEYWSDAYTRKEALRISRRTGENPDELSQGNPLLASLGKQGREFFRFMMELPDMEGIEPVSAFEDFTVPDAPAEQGIPKPGPVLHTIQQDILLNLSRSAIPSPFSGPPLPVPPPEDDSVSVHCCHSELRQVEVLHDRLLRLLEDGSLQPRDILVMAPDITLFEPYINAVFGTGPLKGLYAFSDRSIRKTNRCADAFLELLKTPLGKFETSAVFNLLEHPAISAKGHFSDKDLEKLRHWVSSLGIRWGIDAQNREELCGIAFDEFSWKQGLERLVLGYAVAPDEFSQADDAIFPFDAAEGADGELIGNFCRFLEDLFRLKQTLSAPRPLENWCNDLKTVLDTFFEADDEAYQEISAIRKTLQNLAEIDRRVSLPFPLPPELMLYVLESRMAPMPSAEPFLRGKITFCSLVPMRSIPMKTVAVLGLDDGAFPRRDFPVGFNLIPPEQCRLDRSRTLEDRYLFLELLLAARRHLLLFYRGADNKNNEKYPPAVPLAELLDTLQATFPGASFETRHKLQAFDPDYFRADTPLLSFSKPDYEACAALEETLRNPPPKPELPCREKLLPRKEGEPAPSLPETVSPEELERFFLNTSAAFLLSAAGIGRRFDEEPPVSDEEPFELGSLEAYQLKSAVGRWTVHGLGEEQQFGLLRKTNRLPVSGTGKNLFRNAVLKMERLPGIWLEKLALNRPFMIRLRLGGIEIAGPVAAQPDGAGQYYCRFAKFKAKDRIRLYVRHLLLCAAAPDPEEAGSFAWDHAEAKTIRLSPIGGEEARKRLVLLLELYRKGLAVPLPFFPEASFAYADTPGEGEKKFKAAERAFDSTYMEEGLLKCGGDYAEDPVAKLFSPEDFQSQAFQEEFAETAESFFSFLRNGELTYE